MLTPNEYKLLPENILKIFKELENQIIGDMARSMKETLELSAKTDYQLEILHKMGYDLQQIKREISKTTKLSMKRIDSLMKKSSYLSYENDKKFYTIGGKTLPPLIENPILVNFINATIKQTQGGLRNITNTLGFVDNGSFKPLTRFYKDVLDYATFQIGSGAYDYNTVLRQAVKKLGNSGLRTIDYKSGRKYHIESATRMTVMTGVRQITRYMSEYNADMMDQDLMEITSHSDARPTHQEWQGQIVSRSGKGNYLTLDDIGYGTGDGFGGWNCRHDWYCYFEGISKPAPMVVDTEPFEYEGKTYTGYEASQKQRQIERNIRKTKRELIAYEGAGLKDDVTSAEIKLRRQQELYKDFSKHADLRTKHERTYVYK